MMSTGKARLLSMCLLGVTNPMTVLADTAAPTDPQFTFGGFVKVAALASRYSDGAVVQGPGRDFYLPASLPVTPAPVTHKQYFDTQAKETRLFFGVKAKLEDHSVGAYVEADFISGQLPQQWNSATVGSGGAVSTSSVVAANKTSTNAYNPALRRAYLTYDGVLAGQDWSTFQNTDVLPETTDFIGGVDGMVFVRQPQLRYTDGGFQASLESADTTVATKASGAALTNDNTVPDLVVRYNLSSSAGSYSAAVLVRQLRDSGTVGGLSDTAIGEGVSVAGKIPFSGKADVRFMVTSGRGIGRYVGLGVAGDALIDTSTQRLDAIPVTAALLALHLPLVPHWTGNLILSQESVNLKNSLASGGATVQTQSAAVNAFYSPVKNLSFGGELRYARRNALAAAGSNYGLVGSMNRAEFSAKYAF